MKGLPPHARGMRIGLYGGSFNPPHAAHLMVSEAALRRLRLDRVWWLVTPGNPLKDTRELAPLANRLAAARKLIRDPRIVPTGIEKALGTSYTIDTVRALKRRCPGVRFVWIMGADNLAGFHRWGRWREIAAEIPLAVFDRPGFTLTTSHGRAAISLGNYRLDESDAGVLALHHPPAWIFLGGPRSNLSSTALRQRNAR